MTIVAMLLFRKNDNVKIKEEVKKPTYAKFHLFI